RRIWEAVDMALYMRWSLDAPDYLHQTASFWTEGTPLGRNAETIDHKRFCRPKVTRHSASGQTSLRRQLRRGRKIVHLPAFVAVVLFRRFEELVAAVRGLEAAAVADGLHFLCAQGFESAGYGKVLMQHIRRIHSADRQ